MGNREISKIREKGKTPSEPSSFELLSWKDYYLIIRERLFLGLGVSLLVTGIVGYWLTMQAPLYESEASLLLDRHEERVLGMHQVVETGLDASGQMWRISLENHINQLRSRNFRSSVVESFSEDEARLLIAPHLEDELPPSIGSMVRTAEVENVPNSFILQVKVRHRDPEAAALIANRYVERYIIFHRERRQLGNEAAIRFLKDQEIELKRKLSEAEQRLQDYRRQHNLISLRENQNFVVQRLTAINERLTNARMERIHLETQLRQIETFQMDGSDLRGLFNLSSAGAAPEVAAELDRLRKDREIMSERYGRLHPQMIANQRSIEAAESLLNDNIELAIADLRNRLSNAREHEKDLLVELREAEVESLKLESLKAEYTVLERTIMSNQNTHAQVVDRLDETVLSSQIEESPIRIFDQASASSSPVEPNLKRIGMLVIFLGGFFFVGTPIGLAALDNRLKNARDVEDHLGRKLLGEIPSVSNIRKKFRAHVVARGSDDRAAEGFRGLFSQLQLTSKAPYPKSLMATSTMPSEGKSFVVSNLATACASHGKRTLMIDFDLRRPSLHHFYERLNEKGVLNWLRDGGDFEGDILENESLGIMQIGPNLFLLPSGGQTKKATEVLNDPRINNLIQALRREFDILMIDAPPMGIFPDALALAQMVDESMYVSRFGKVDRQQVMHCVGRLSETRAELLGVVMNGMPRGARFAHYYSGYGVGNYKYSQYYTKA